MKVLVTGGAGFIGSHVVDAYLKEGHEVAVVDNLSSGKEENINSKARFYHLDIQDPQIEKIFKEYHFDLVNHHAAQVDVRRSVTDPIFDAEVNVIGLLNILQNCVRFGVKRFIFASSGGVIYGEPATLPAKETFPLMPLSPYGVSKLMGEQYLHYYQVVHQLDFCILRYANVYGPRQDPSGEAGVVAIFISNLLNRDQPKIFGDGEQLRDYVYVGDVVRANLLAITRGTGEAFNIATGKATSVNRLLSLIQSMMGTDVKPIYCPKRPGEIYKNFLDINKAEALLGWRPKVPLSEGLKKTLDFFKKKFKLTDEFMAR
jgi:UDP-glucose 4-epimerase